MSLVTWSPATGITAVWRIAPPEKTAMSVVPPPTSTRQTPSSFSSSVSTANEDASCSSTMSSTTRPQRSTHFTMFCAALSAPVTMCTRASRRTPDMPTGSRIPSCPSMMNSCGRTWRIFWSAGIGTACAASMTRATSPPATSLSLIATMPCELRLRTWLPAMPVNTERISTPAISSASSTARWMDCTVESMLTTTPFLRPREGCEPRPITSRLPSLCISPTSDTTFDVPMSSPTIRLRSVRLAIEAGISVRRVCRAGGPHGLRPAVPPPADRESVRVAHVDVADLGRAARDHLHAELHEAVHALVDLAAPEAHGDAGRKVELPGAARIEPERGDLEAELAEAVLHREVALRDLPLGARRPVQPRQLRRRMPDTRREQLAARVEEAVVAPARGRLLLDDLDAQSIGPEALHARAIDPDERLHAFAEAVEVRAHEAALQRAERRLLHLDRGHALERAVDLEAAHRLVEAEREQDAERGDRRDRAEGTAHARPGELRHLDAAPVAVLASVAPAQEAHGQVLSRAKLASRMRQHSAGNSTPAARAAIGTRLWLVMPGIVLISSRSALPSSPIAKSTRPQPEAPVAAKVARAAFCRAASAGAPRPQGIR